MAEFDELDTNTLIQNLLNPQSQAGAGQEPGVLEMLTSLLGPQEAEAASAPDPWTRQFKELQLRNQQQRQLQSQQQLQQGQQRIDLQRQKQLQKSAPPISGPALTQQISQVLGQGAAAEPQLTPTVFKGKTPGTGTPFFGDQPPGFASPEELQSFEQRKQQSQEAFTAAKAKQATSQPATSKGQISPERLAQSVQLAKMLKDGGYPPETTNLVLRNTFPELAEQKASEAGRVAGARSKVTLERQKAFADYANSLAAQREKDKPLPPAVARQLEFGDELQRQMDTIGQAVDAGTFEKFVGPVAGRTFEYRRQIEGQTSPEEVTMRRSLAQLKNVNLYMRSGVAINEAEAQRLIAELPNENDEPDAFRQKFEDFQRELSAQIRTKRKTASMSRADVAAAGDAPLAGAPSGATSKPMAQPPPASQHKGRVGILNGKRVISDGTNWVPLGQ